MIVYAKNLSKYYGRSTALEDVNFDFEDADIIGLIGNNGAGKTTLLNLIMGNARPSSGCISVMDLNPFDNVLTAKNSIFVDEKMRFDPFLSLKSIIEQYDEYDDGFSSKTAYKILDAFDIDIHKKHAQLSKGMKNQFNIAVGFALNRPITVMDEPVSGLDEGARKMFYRVLLDEFCARPRLFIVSTHLLGEFKDSANRFLLLRQGKLIAFEERSHFDTKLVKVEGPRAKMGPFLSGRMIYETEELGPIASVVVNNALTHTDKKFLAETGLTLKPVSANDACIYLCKEEKRYDYTSIL